MQSLAFTPMLPVWLLVAFGGAALGLCAWGFAARARGATLRFASFACLLAALCGPHIVIQTVRPLPNVALVLLDQSDSMQIGRRAALQAQALAALQSSAGTTQLRVVAVPPRDAGGTSLTAAAAAALSGIAPAQLAGIIAITDGQLADLPAIPDGVPFTALLTAAGEETDRELHVISAPTYGLVGQTVPFTFMVRDHGPAPAGAPATVTVMEDNVAVATVPATPGLPVTVALPIRHPGPQIVTASVTPLPGAVTDLNASVAFTLTGIHKQLNILLISGFPDQGERAWRVLLRADPTVQLVHFTILRTPREALDANERDLALVPFPVRELFEQDIGKFDLIILDGFNAQGVLPPPYLANIATYVQQGGALLAEVGPEFAGPESLAASGLGPVLPANPVAPGTVTGRFIPALTDIGTRDPVTSPFINESLAPWYRQDTAEATAGQVLMTGAGGNPLLILADTGKGRTGLLLSDQLWLWTRQAPPSGPALPLLRRIVHWLLREPSLEAESLTATVAGDQLTVTRQTLSAAAPPAAQIVQAGQTTSLALNADGPGHYTGTLRLKAAPGVIRIEQGGLTAFAAASRPNPQEFEDLAATAHVVEGKARNVVWLGQRGAPALAGLVAPRHATQVMAQRQVPLAPPLVLFGVIFGLIVGAWWRERG